MAAEDGDDTRLFVGIGLFILIALTLFVTWTFVVGEDIEPPATSIPAEVQP